MLTISLCPPDRIKNTVVDLYQASFFVGPTAAVRQLRATLIWGPLTEITVFPDSDYAFTS